MSLFCLVWYTLLTCLHISSGPLRWEQAFNSRLADLSFASNWSQSSKIFCCRSLYFRRWILLSFLSDTSRIWSDVSLASLWRRWISSYMGSCPRPDEKISTEVSLTDLWANTLRVGERANLLVNICISIGEKNYHHFNRRLTDCWKKIVNRNNNLLWRVRILMNAVGCDAKIKTLSLFLQVN